MHVQPIRTGKITGTTQTLEQILDATLAPMREGSILAITSKIVAICEGRVAPIEDNKEALIERESDLFLNRIPSVKYPVYLTVKNSTIIANAGIDESNGNGFHILWPRDAQTTANDIRAYLKKRFSLKDIGVIVTDSKTTPLRWGTSGVALAHSGFKALKSYIDKPDVFGRPLTMTMGNIAEGLAAAAVVAMGEGSEQTPLAVIDDLPFVEFQKRNPTKQELAAFRIRMKNDMYSQLLTAVSWKKGKRDAHG